MELLFNLMAIGFLFMILRGSPRARLHRAERRLRRLERMERERERMEREREWYNNHYDDWN